MKYVVYTLVAIIVLLLILVLILYMIRSPLIFRSGASTITQTNVQQSSPATSISNSYIFASPLRAKAGGEKIRVTVYILDDGGMGVVGKQVAIAGGNLLTVSGIQPLSDAQGRAMFDISSTTSGTFIIEATSDGITLSQKATISFD